MISQLSVKDSALMLSHICLMILDGRGDEEMIDSLLKAATHMTHPELKYVLALVTQGYQSKSREDHINPILYGLREE